MLQNGTYETYTISESEIDGYIPENMIPTYQVGDTVLTDKGDILTINLVKSHMDYLPYRASNGQWYTPLELKPIDY